MGDFKLAASGWSMEPESGNPNEVGGVPKSRAVRGLTGHCISSRAWSQKGNYSRIGIARVRFNESGDPADVERLGIALEPEADYERRPDGSGGCEDSRVTFVAPLQRYLMTYTAWSSMARESPLAVSEDIPAVIPDPSGQPELALLHRPLFPGTRPEETACCPATREVDIDRESIWISYCQMTLTISPFTPASLLFIIAWHPSLTLGTAQDWRRHSTCLDSIRLADRLPRCQRSRGARLRQPHAALFGGVMIFSKEHPLVISYRSPEPVLSPELSHERRGIVANVVFPTGIDRRDDLGTPIASMSITGWRQQNRRGAPGLADQLPTEAVADSAEARV